MRCEAPRGHEAVLAGLFAAARARRLAHALLFVGPDGVGKFLAAGRLAAGLLCARGPGEPCGACGPCKRVEAGSHADLFVVDAEADGEEQIEIGRIAPRTENPRPNVGEFLSLKPLEGGWRIVLLREAHRMNTFSQNALLKTLEEPGPSTLLVLETARPELLLETTRSRCVRVAFAPLAAGETAAVLAAHGVDGEQASRLARWGQGSPGEALRLAARGATAMRALLERVLAGGVTPFEAAAELAEVEGEFPGKTPSAQSRARVRAFLDLALAVLLDLRRAEAGVPASALAHGDLAAAAGAGAGLVRELQLEACLAARQDVDANLAPDAAVERALWALAPARAGAAPAAARSARNPR